MSVEATENQSQEKPNSKEFNFRQLEAKYENIVAQERAEKEKLMQQLEEARKTQTAYDDSSDDEPYVDHKKLEKKLAKFGEQTEKKTEGKIQQAVQHALNEERKKNWLSQNPDFYDVLQHAEKIVEKDPELAATILEMPDGFERQKLVYRNIKALNLHKPEQKQPSIQEKIDANRRSPYYQPSGIAAAPYAAAGDFSASGQKNAYEKMKELQKQMRL